MRYLFCGGGTAGHVYPALAIAETLSSLDGNAEIFFIGTKNGMENQLVRRAGYPIWQIDAVGLKRSLSLKNLSVAVKTAKAVGAAKRIISDLRPDAVIGTGGYACYPVVRVAYGMGIYTALHESNAVAGLAVKTLSKKADRIFTGFPECIGIKNGIYTGNPLRSGLLNVDRESARAELGINGKYKYLTVSFGGSLGARAVNEIALCVMERLSAVRSDVVHYHSCGRDGEYFFAQMKARGLDGRANIRVSEYIHNMPTLLCAADAVICRSGAMTLAELAAANAPAVLVPSPNVTGAHQLKNAKSYEAAGAAYLVDERETGACERALTYMTALLTDPDKRERMRRCIGKLSRPDASIEVAKTILEDIRR